MSPRILPRRCAAVHSPPMLARALVAPLLLGTASLAPMLLAGCGDPYDRPGTWHATGVNEANLAAMTVDKANLVRGHEDPGSDALLDAAAVTRLYSDHAKPLREEATTNLPGSGNGSASSGNIAP